MLKKGRHLFHFILSFVSHTMAPKFQMADCLTAWLNKQNAKMIAGGLEGTDLDATVMEHFNEIAEAEDFEKKK